MSDIPSTAQLTTLLNTSPDGIIIIDEKGSIVLFSRACENLFGYHKDEVIGKNISILMPKEDARHHDDYIAHYLQTGERKIIGYGREVQGKNKDGSLFPLELSIGETKIKTTRQFVGILRDIRRRKNAEERLKAIQSDLIHLTRASTLDEMGATLAHEINQPLTALKLYLQASLKCIADFDNHEKVSAPLEKAFGEVERVRKIIQHMRHFVENREPQRQNITIKPIVEGALDLIRVSQPLGALKLHIDYQDDDISFYADHVQMQQILVNLIRNAIEASKAQTPQEVWITTRVKNNALYVDVLDNGKGISKEVLPKLFKAFSSTKTSGMGLGLSISRSIAQSHGGDLRVDPGGGSKGACFTLCLPIH